MKKLLFFLMAIVFAIQGWAQIVTIGSGTTGKYDMPINTFYNYSYTQQIFDSTEIGAQVGVINSLSFQYIYGTSQVKNNVKIYIGNTTKTAFSSTTDWVPISSMDEVFSGSVNFTNTAAGNWVNIVFDSPFIWNGTSNIVIAVVNNHGSYSSSSNNTFNTHSVTGNKSLRYNTLTSPVSPSTTTHTGTLGTYRSNIQLEFGAAPTCLTPGALTFNNYTHNSIDVSWIKKGTAQIWDVEYKLTSDTNWLNATTTVVTDSTISLSNLLPNTNYDIRVRSNCGGMDLSLWRTSNFTTLCTPTITFPITENFDNLGGSGAAFFPSCWSRITTYSTYPYSTTTNHSWPYSLYLYATTGNYNLAILNGIDQSINVNTLEVSFWMRKGSATSDLIVGVMSDPKDPTSFVGIDTVAPSATGVWEPFDVSLASYTGTGNHIAFLGKAVSANNYSYLDDVVVDYIPSCPKPTNVTFTNITSTSATVSWTPGSVNDFAWWVYHRPPGTTKWDSVYVTTNSYSFSSLSPSASYEVEIKADCGTGLSKPSYSKILLTSCGLISSIPWSQTFDSYGTGSTALPTCWGRKTTYSNYPYINTTAYSSPGAMYFYATSGNYNISIFPGLDQNININNLTLFLKVYKSSAAYNITVGVMSDTANVTTFDSILNLSPSTTSTWENFAVDLSSYTGTGRYIALKCDGIGATNVIIVDNIVLDYSPPCSTPIGLTMIDSLQTLNSMTIDWDGADDANVLSWKVEYKPYDDAIWLDTTVFVHPVTLPNLQSSVVYQVKVSATCSNGYITYPTAIKNYGMPCEIISNFPWTEGFEKVWYVAAGLNTGTHPWCWTNINGGTQANGEWRKTASSTYIRTGSGALQMYSGSTSAGGSSDWFISPVFTLTGNERLQFWAKGYSPYVDDLNIQIFDVTTNGIVDNASDTSLFTVVMPNVTVPMDNWTMYEVSLTQFIGDYQIAFVRNTTGGYFLNIDDISISLMPQCSRPTSVSFSNVQANSVEVDWIPANQTDNAWWVYYKQVGTSIWDSVYALTHPINITNLSANTNYDVLIRTDCGYQLSNTSLPANFFTLCVAIDGLTALPWNEGFEGINAANQLPICWSSTNLGTATFTQTSDYGSYNRNARTGTRSAYFRYGCNDKFTTPIFELYAGQSYAFKFWYVTDGYPGWQNLQARVVSVNDTTVNQIIGAPVVNANNTTYQMYLGSFIAPTTGQYEFSIECLANGALWYLTIDDIGLEVSNCPIPDNLTFSNITPTSADLTWGMGTATQWQLEYKENSSSTWTSMLVNTNTYSFTNLLPNTNYNFRVASICGLDTSMFMPTNLLTPCTFISTLPYTENFDNYGTGTGTYPSCWNKFSQYSATYPYISTTNFSSPGALYFYSYNNQQTYASFGPIDSSISMNTLRVKFKMYYSSLNYHNLQVGVMTDPNDITTFTPVDNVQSVLVASTWEDKEVSLSSYTGTGRYIAFKTVAPASSYNYGYMDNVVLDYIPTCPKPVSLSVSNITTTSVDINWLTGGNNTTNWWLYWKPATATNYDSVYVSNVNTHTLSNLNTNSAYNYYMRTDCTTELSEPTSVYSFRTACGIITSVPWNDFFDTYGTGTTIFPPCWTRNTTYADRPYVNGTNFTAPGSLYFFAGTSGTYNIAATPQFDVTIPINTLQATFMLRKSNSTDSITIGVMTDPTQEATFVPVSTVAPSATSTWEPFDVSFASYTGTGTYIAFKIQYNNIYCYMYMDNLEIYPIPTCTRPNKPVVTNPTLSSLDVSWTDPNPNNTLYKVYYRLLGDTTWTVINNATSPTTLTGLATTSGYEIAVATDCTTEESMLSYITTGRTACGTVTALPFADNFDTYGTGTSIMPDCWVRNTSYALRPYVNTGGFSGNCLYFYSGTAGTYAMAITPQFDPSIQLNTLKLNFKFRSFTANSDTLRIGVMTDTSYASFVEVGKVFGPTSWNDYQVDLSSYTGTGTYIGFMVKFGSINTYAYVDNLVISANVSCAAPTNVVANNIATTSADISWTAGGSETSWQIKQGASGTPIDLTNNQYQATGLTANTPYTYHVRSNCTNGVYSSWVPVTFTTNNMPTNPVVTTSQVTAYTHNTATFTGSYTEGSDVVTAIGFDYKLASASNWTNTPITPLANPFNYSATGLTPNTAYKVRAYATTSAGTFYGDSVNFTTDPLLPPTVTTDTVIMNTTDFSAVFQGTTSQGTNAIIARGFEYKLLADDWSTAIDLTASGSANITATATGLSAVKYQVRAYAETLDGGKTYGAVLDFDMGSSINSIDTDNLNVNLYPNPASNNTTLSIKGVNGKVKISITDVQGRSISTIERESSNGEVNHSINLEAYAKGVYYIRIQSDSSIKTQKLIVQ